LEKAHAEERELWKTEHAKDQEKVSQAIQKAIQEQRKISQETVKAAIIEEQKRSEKAVEEAVKRTRDELIEYVKEQKREKSGLSQQSGIKFLPLKFGERTECFLVPYKLDEV